MSHSTAILAVVLLVGCARAALACPGDGGPTGACDVAKPAPASLPSSVASVQIGAGNPINVITGNKYQREDDLPALPGVLGLEIVRHYNSRHSGAGVMPGLLGRGWKLSYETELAITGHTIQVFQADGGSFMFGRDLVDRTRANADDPANGAIAIRRNRRGGEEYVWRWIDGRELSFDQRGKLMQIRAATGETLSLLYDVKGMLVKVTDPQGRSLRLLYPDRRLSADGDRFRGVRGIDSPVGRFSYDHGDGSAATPSGRIANLARVRYPGEGEGRRYHYEDAAHPAYLTGITLDGGRYATYAYQADGRAVLSTHANNIDKVTLRYDRPGQTTVTNSLGQRTVYRYATVADDLRLLEVRGAGCALCGPTNQRYGYDKLGRLIEIIQLNDVGVSIESSLTERDLLGRTVRVSRIVYQGGKAGRPQMQMRYVYAGRTHQPLLIARPSVVSGKEAMTWTTFDQNLRPVKTSNDGFVPGYDGKAVFTISRSTGYRYNARGQLIEVDGPLPNASGRATPANSDITTSEYDPLTGLILKSTAPGNIVTQVFERDAALRPARLGIDDGDSAQTIIVTRNWRGQPEQITVEAMRRSEVGRGDTLKRSWRYRYDSQGHVVHVTLPGNLSTAFYYDVNGRLSERVLPDGTRQAVKQDGKIEQQDARGATRLHYTAQGRLEKYSNELGIDTEFHYDDNGWVTLSVAAANTSDAASSRFHYDRNGQLTRFVDPNGVVTSRLYDDFGAKVMEASSDRGMTLFRYDDAGRLLARLALGGAITRYSYDHAGRMTAMGTDSAPGLVQYRYQGRHLSEVTTTADGQLAHATERVQYETNVMGQLTRETRWIGPLRGHGDNQGRMPAAGLTFVTSTRYDEAGRVLTQTLPDGHRLHHRYVEAGQKGAGLLAAVLFDDQLLVSEIEQSQHGGITGYLMGNGSRQRIVLDKSKRITELHTLMERTLGEKRAWGGWLNPGPVAAAAVLYQQRNRYDVVGRLESVERVSASSAPTRERYAYDDLDRLRSVTKADDSVVRWGYDRGGNRSSQTAVSSSSEQWTQRYQYISGTNRLGAVDDDKPDLADAAERGPVGGAEEPAQLRRAAWMYNVSGVPSAQILLVRVGGMASTLRTAARRIEYGGDERPLAVYEGMRRVATYRYNSQGERIARTVYEPDSTAGRTVYSLFQDQRVSAEADDDGRITAHYIYLGGKAIAKVEMTANDGLPHRLWRYVATLGGLRDADPIGDSEPSIYAIHSDHLGTPQLVTDASKRVVWQAHTTPFGLAHIRYAAVRSDGSRFDLALRLPGQLYDSATGLHYNYARDYDPQLGRYTTPDPLGLEGGINPYAYAGGDPLGNVDPLGLYQIDVHYYMTYFLAIAAGVDKDLARRIALATQYIDDNEVTRPMKPIDKPFDYVDSVFVNKPALVRYHFVMAGNEPDRTVMERAAYLLTGHDLQSYIDRRILNPSSLQLSRLLDASIFAKTDPNANCNSSIQLFGEYLHTLEDSFAHRDRENNPYDAAILPLGIGHGPGGESPDYTYNHFSIMPLGFGWWNNNAARTLQMEKEVFQKMQAYSNPKNKQYSWAGIVYTMATFNEFQANDSSTNFADKIAILSKGFKTLGYSDIDLTGNDAYSEEKGAKNRADALNSLKPEDYIGTILPQGAAPLPK